MFKCHFCCLLGVSKSTSLVNSQYFDSTWNKKVLIDIYIPQKHALLLNSAIHISKVSLHIEAIHQASINILIRYIF